MNNYIDILLFYKNKEYIKETKKNVDKKSTYIYLESCIIFIYDNKNIISLKGNRKIYQQRGRKRSLQFTNYYKQLSS